MFHSREGLAKAQAIIIIVIIAVVIGGAAYYLSMPGPPTPTPTPTPSPTPTPTPTATPTPTPTPTPGEVYEVESLKDLFNLAPEMSYRWTDSNDTQTEIDYRVVGEEEVEGVACWTVEVSIKNGGEEAIAVWVSKEDGTAKKVKIEGTEFTGEMAEQLWSGLGVMVMFPFVTGSSWRLWEMPYITDPTYGTAQYLGSEARTYGETVLTVEQYRFLPGAAWYEEDLDNVDYWFADVEAYTILTYFKYALKSGEWGSFELLEIKLA